MSEYVERLVRFGAEGTFGTYIVDTPVYYCLGFEATTTEERIEEDLVSPSRQAFSRIYVQRTVVGSMEENVLSPRLAYYALGWANSDTVSPYTVNISGTHTLPSFSLERGLTGATGTIFTGYKGCKVDRFELLVEAEQDIVQTIDWVAQDNTFPTQAWTVATASFSTYPANPLAYYHAELKWGTSTIRLKRARLEINNNLVPVFASEEVGDDPVLVELREGAQVVTGDFIVDVDINTFANTAVRGRNEGTITITMGNDNRGTITYTLNRVALDEFVDAVRGRDIYEVTFPFRARPDSPTAYNAIDVSWASTIAGTISDAMI